MRTPATLLALASVLALSELAGAQVTSRVSVDSAGAQGDGWSDTYGGAQTMSADGRLVAFGSGSTNLVAGDTNGHYDVFVRDRTTGVTERVSVDSSGAEANGDSWKANLSADGRFVAFASYASNLVSGDNNAVADVFVHDRSTGVTERVSVDSSGNEAFNGAGGDTSSIGISADGRFVAFSGGDLVSGDTNGTWDVFVHDRTTGVTERVSVDSSGGQADLESHCHGISADGNVVVFDSFARNLVASDTNLVPDVLVHVRSTGITERVSVDSSGGQTNDGSDECAISADGTVVVFASLASNLVSGDTNGVYDVFVHDRTTGLTERESVDSAGVQGNKNSSMPTISADHRFVAFNSDATNLVAGDANKKRDVYVRDRTAGKTERVSLDSSGSDSNSASDDPSISQNGQVVLFWSDASDLVSGDTNGFADVFARDRCDATWSNYGAGFPGTNGVPSFTAQADPILGTTVTVDLANSLGSATVGAVFVGFQRAAIPSSWGGDLLVLPFVTTFVNLPAGGMSLSGGLPDDELLCGFVVDLQAIELDAGAAKGVSLTPGLELVLGR